MSLKNSAALVWYHLLMLLLSNQAHLLWSQKFIGDSKQPRRNQSYRALLTPCWTPITLFSICISHYRRSCWRPERSSMKCSVRDYSTRCSQSSKTGIYITHTLLFSASMLNTLLLLLRQITFLYLYNQQLDWSTWKEMLFSMLKDYKDFTVFNPWQGNKLLSFFYVLSHPLGID